MEFAPALFRLAAPLSLARARSADALRGSVRKARRLALHSSLLPLLFVFVAYSLAPFAAHAQTSQTSQSAPIERELSGGELHSFRLLLNPGQFVRAVFDQRGVDIVLTLAGPNNEELLKIDSPNGEWGPEPLFFEVEAGGYYTIQVRPRKASAGPGRYEFAMTGRRATVHDERQFPAERVFAEATRSLVGAASLPKYRR
jgi:hypothetical protein